MAKKETKPESSEAKAKRLDAAKKKAKDQAREQGRRSKKASDVRQTRINDPAVPQENEEIEASVLEFLKASQTIAKATNTRTAAYDKIKELMVENDLSVYDCYQRRYQVLCRKRDEDIKVKERKEATAK